jgi:hypothetical protein
MKCNPNSPDNGRGHVWLNTEGRGPCQCGHLVSNGNAVTRAAAMKDMFWEDAVLQAIDEQNKMGKNAAIILLQMLLRAGQLTTDTRTREDSIRDAVAFEREQCAQVAEHSGESKVSTWIAENIRARGKP